MGFGKGKNKEILNFKANLILDCKQGNLENINIKHLDTREIELKSKTKFISLKYDNGKWKMLLERWI